MNKKNRITIQDILEKKRRKEKITMLTAYDYPLASVIDKSEIDIILVGDSLANVVLGLKTTREVGMPEMIHHAKAANRAVEHSLLVGDMPYGSYQKDSQEAVKNAKRFVDEAGCDAVKLEWFEGCLETAQKIVEAGIPVMGHVGLTPQTADQKDGLKVQGKELEDAKEIIHNAKALEEKGCFSIVLECIPGKLAEIITSALNIPTIGIGAGVHCDGQVLVTHDLLGLFDRFQPKFAKQYVNLADLIHEAVVHYRDEVKEAKFPGPAHTFVISEEVLRELKKDHAVQKS